MSGVTWLGYPCKGLMSWVSWCVDVWVQEDGGPVTVTLQHQVRHSYHHTRIHTYFMIDQGLLSDVCVLVPLVYSLSMPLQDGSVESVVCGFVGGCDGAHSQTRRLLKLPFKGDRYDETFVLADVTVRPRHSF